MATKLDEFATTEFSMIRRWIGNSKSWLRSFLNSVYANEAIVSVVVMGSAVREGVHRRSDFDLLIIYRGKRPVFRPPLEVDLRFADIDRVENQLAAGDEVLCWALKFGIAILDSKHYWHDLVKSWSGKLRLPSATQARQRAAKCLSRAVEMLAVKDDSAADDLVLSAATQFARERLIENGVFPASRPELPGQLRELDENDAIAQILHDAMFGDVPPEDLVRRLGNIANAVPCGK